MRTLADLNARKKRVLVRVDYNVPLEGGRVADATRIRASLPTLERLLAEGAALVLMSHLGRPKGYDPALSLAPVAGALAELLGREVRFVPSLPSSEATREAVAGLAAGEVALLENVRFEPGEKKNDPELARAYAR
ncbi:MAG TPA: phosphoglycerate kinase, partial [Oceanithermus profundus]|nr:phosphoglycerate kinase [Oceanithermus profundus]